MFLVCLFQYLVRNFLMVFVGYGSHGTVVYRGTIQGEAVAVKRFVKHLFTISNRELKILEESENHPNVIRYYYQESIGDFLYIAMELCPASLAEVIEHPDMHDELFRAMDAKSALRQVVHGLKHLHSLGIIHRDLKPQNILICDVNDDVDATRELRILISDFGIYKRRKYRQTSFLPPNNDLDRKSVV